MKKLHPKQAEILDLLHGADSNNLTIRDMQELLKISSTSVVYHHLTQLEKKGFLTKQIDGNYRINQTDQAMVYVNLYGDAQCGPNGLLLDGEIEEIFAFSANLLPIPPTEAFLVRARGDSMLPRIASGDLVIGRKRPHYESGSIVICAVSGEVMIKKLIFSAWPFPSNAGSDFGDEEVGGQGIRLESLNPVYQPILPEPDQLHVAGVVAGIMSFNI